MRGLLLLITGLLFSYHAFSQNYRFNTYGAEDGLAQNFIYSLDQDRNGYLWVGTGEGLSRFDGNQFTSYTTDNGLAENMIVSSYKDSKGGVWFGHNIGTLTYRNPSGKFTVHSNPALTESVINGITGFGDQVYFISQNDGLFTIEDGKFKTLGKFGENAFYSLHQIDKSSLLVGTGKGLLHLNYDGSHWEKSGTYFKGSYISVLTPSTINGVFIVGTLNGKIFKVKALKSKLNVQNVELPDVLQSDLLTVTEDAKHNFWIGTAENGMIKVMANHTEENPNFLQYNESTGLPSNYVHNVFIDREGGVWLGTFGEGLLKLDDDFFTFYTYEREGEISDVTAIWADEEVIWMGTNSGIIRKPNNSLVEERFFSAGSGFVDDKVTSIYQTGDNLWIGTSHNGLFKYDRKREVFRQIPWSYGTLQNNINEISGNDQNLWIATQGGLIAYRQESASTDLYGTSEGLAHNAIQTVYEDHGGDIWVGTFSRYIYQITDKEIIPHELMSSGTLEIVSITEDSENHIWIATNQSGVFEIINDQITYYSAKDGLKSNYTTAIGHDINGDIWIGHEGGLTKIIKVKDSKKGTYKNVLKIYDHKTGIRGLVNRKAMTLDLNRNLWIGTENGAIRYNAAKDVINEIPPVVNLVRIWIGEKSYSPDQEIVLPYGTYRVQFEFIGVSFRNPEAITYRYFLDGHDLEFSNPSSESTATYGRISDGSYTFKVLAFNGNNNASELAAEVKLVVRTPFWKKWWFWILISIAAIFGLIRFIKYRERVLREQQEYLESELAIKTKEVVEKAEKIEDINNDLMGSINYAQRIQSSILPDQKILQDILPNSFIFFNPRDVVSGDFYFIEKIGSKLIVACCDCTGHGVPGAFMSMIGSVTIGNIYSTSEYGWKTPEKVMEEIDAEVKRLLQSKNLDNKSSAKDGMDMTLCEIDLETRDVSLCSARRRSILTRANGEHVDIKGDKRSIGEDNNEDVQFLLQKFKVAEGDALYLFTDGYPDQFGGDRGKKLMISGTKEIINGLQFLNRDSYGGSIRSNFLLWKSDYEQIDDVLFMGLIF